MNITSKILYTIHKKGKGWVFSPQNFIKIRHLNTINPLLDRLEKRGHIRSLGKGLYDYPIIDKETNLPKPPKLDFIIRALEIQLTDKFAFNKEYSAFLFGVNKSLSGKIKYLTNNKQNKKIEVAGYNIELTKTSIPISKNKYDKSLIAVHAILYFGKKKISDEIIKKIISQLNEQEIKRLKALTKFAPAWVKDILDMSA